jgi:hypothetical protein
LKANRPKCGIVFNGVPYVGTSDGFISSQGKETQRVPELLVDSEIFIDEYPFRTTEERDIFRIFASYEKKGLDYLMRVAKKRGRRFMGRMLDIGELMNNVKLQERNMDRYLDERMDWLAIVGFVVNKGRASHDEPLLYDACRLGIYETITGKRVNSLVPQRLHQLNPELAGFVPSGNPVMSPLTLEIKAGIEERTERECVDYRSLWTLNGKGILVRDICPRDGSGYRGAEFVTDGKTTAKSHGNCPEYRLDIEDNKTPGCKRTQRIKLPPSGTPWKLFLKEGQVFGFYTNRVINHSAQKTTLKDMEVSSVSESGLGSVVDSDKSRTRFYDITTGKLVDEFTGNYRFLPQRV